jgi:tetratricopeptide (TPR) repeat protein
VVNLSLLNTEWYIKQLRDDEPRVPIAFSDRDIDTRLTSRNDESLLLRYWPEGRRQWAIPTPGGDKIEWEVPATLYIPTGLPNEKRGEPNFLRVQDIMVLHIIEQMRWKRPIYFAVTVSQQNMLALNPWLSMEGLVFKLHPEKVETVNPQKLKTNLFETYATNYRNLDNPDVYYFGNIITLLQNYRSGFLQLALHYYRQYDMNRENLRPSSSIPEEQWEERFDELVPREKALASLRKMNEVITLDAVPLTNSATTLQLARLMVELGDKQLASDYYMHAYELAEQQGSTEDQLRSAFFLWESVGNEELARDMVREVIENRRTSTTDLIGALTIYERFGDSTAAQELLERIGTRNLSGLREQLEIANVYVRYDQLDRAEEIYLDLLAEQPRNPEVYGGLVNIYEARADSQSLVGILDQWLAINPNDRQALRLRERFSVGENKTTR